MINTKLRQIIYVKTLKFKKIR